MSAAAVLVAEEGHAKTLPLVQNDSAELEVGAGARVHVCYPEMYPFLRCFYGLLVQAMAFETYARQDYQTTVDLLSQIISREQNDPRLREMRAQVEALEAHELLELGAGAGTEARQLDRAVPATGAC